KRTENIDDIWDLKDEDDFLKRIDDKIDIKRVKEHLSLLPSLQRDIIIMRIWQDMSYGEIAEVIGKSEDNCKVIYSRAIAKLRESISIISFILLISKI
ncbi:MAG: sigma-70 family RNA polymerase sigma factor, partial [Patescibacteria group bacterium]